jgi:hypothetical protein
MLRTFSRVVPCASDLVAEACNQLLKNNKKLINPSGTQLQIKIISCTWASQFSYFCLIWIMACN